MERCKEEVNEFSKADEYEQLEMFPIVKEIVREKFQVDEIDYFRKRWIEVG